MSYRLARLYIPKYPNTPVFQMERRLAAAFGGYTLYPMCVGVWMNPDSQQLVQEGVNTYDVVIHGTKIDEEALLAILMEYKQAANQHTVLYVLDNTPTFI